MKHHQISRVKEETIIETAIKGLDCTVHKKQIRSTTD